MRNPWVRFVHEQWLLAMVTWEASAEAVSIGYASELADYAAQCPRPRFRDFLVGLSPLWQAGCAR